MGDPAVVIGYVFVAVFVVTIGSIATLAVLVVLHRREIARMDEITIGRPVVIDHFLYQGCARRTTALLAPSKYSPGARTRTWISANYPTS